MADLNSLEAFKALDVRTVSMRMAVEFADDFGDLAAVNAVERYPLLAQALDLPCAVKVSLGAILNPLMQLASGIVPMGFNSRCTALYFTTEMFAQWCAAWHTLNDADKEALWSKVYATEGEVILLVALSVRDCMRKLGIKREDLTELIDAVASGKSFKISVG